MALPVGLEVFFIVLLGLCLGSFATALSWRIPRGVSIIKKHRSSCPSCRRDLTVLDLVPFFSWVFLRGACRYCGNKIGWRYPAIELSTVLLCLVFYVYFGFSFAALPYIFSAPILVSMMDIDFQHKILPDSLNLALLVLGFFRMDLDWTNAMAGMALYGLGSFALRYVFLKIKKREAMGLGDVKFFAVAGFWLGADPELLAAFLFLAGVFGVVIALFWKKLKKEAEFPFGPALITAFTLCLLSYSDEFEKTIYPFFSLFQ
jgi:leader peptidase (prepilin peptidase)/N-methyltransferase